MNRYTAFFSHLFISAVVVGILLALTFFVWYPAPYFEVDGAMSVIGILAMVDVFLGPLLTFIVFKPGKPRLKLDLGMIAAVQLTAFVYGAHVIFSERPGYVVHLIDQFIVVPTSAVDFSKASYPELEVGLFSGPSLTYLHFRKDGESLEEMLARVHGCPRGPLGLETTGVSKHAADNTDLGRYRIVPPQSLARIARSLVFDPERLEDLVLDLRLVDTDTPPAQLLSIDDQVVSPRIETE